MFVCVCFCSSLSVSECFAKVSGKGINGTVDFPEVACVTDVCT